MKLIKAGSTSKSIDLFIQDSSSTTGAGLAGLAFNTASLTAHYHRPGANPVAITLATQTPTGAFSSGGFVAVDGTNMPGMYRLDVPDAALAAGVDEVTIMLKGAANMAPLPVKIGLTVMDLQDGVRGGLTALPNAAAEAAGGLYTRGTGAGQINQPANGRIDANAITIAAAAVQSIWDALTSALTTAGSVGKRIADFITGDAFVRLGAPAGASVSADVAAIKVDTTAEALRATKAVIRGTVGNATTPSSTQFTPSALTPAGVDLNQFVGRVIVFDNDTTTPAIRGQATAISASTAAALPLLTFTALSRAPASGDTFAIV